MDRSNVKTIKDLDKYIKEHADTIIVSVNDGETWKQEVLENLPDDVMEKEIEKIRKDFIVHGMIPILRS